MLPTKSFRVRLLEKLWWPLRRQQTRRAGRYHEQQLSKMPMMCKRCWASNCRQLLAPAAAGHFPVPAPALLQRFGCR